MLKSHDKVSIGLPELSMIGTIGYVSSVGMDMNKGEAERKNIGAVEKLSGYYPATEPGVGKGKIIFLEYSNKCLCFILFYPKGKR
jgi:hypothetical protein